MKDLKKILYVEDDSDIQTVAHMALKFSGFEVESCFSGMEAIGKIRQFVPDIILLDVMMPGMDGPTTLKAIRSLPGAETTPVVFMTAKVQTHEIENYKKLGALDVIIKPFDPMTLGDNLKAIWKKHRE